jgi:hypothetical protein
MSRPGKVDVVATRVDSLPDSPPAGAFMYLYAADGKTIVGMSCACPCGCGNVYNMRFIGPAARGFSGTYDKPTVTGAFGMYPTTSGQELLNGPYHWQGFLTDGVFLEC